MRVTACLLCSSNGLERVLNLGFHPLADTFLKPEQLNASESRYPLELLLCSTCGHVMESFIVPPEKRYQENEYSYDSGNSKVSIQHFDEMAQDVIAKSEFQKGDLAVDIGSSVGTLLNAFREHGSARVLGVEPASNIAAIANKNRISTLNDFWGQSAADEILTYGKPKVITITNAFNHIGDLDGFMAQIARALSPDGVFVAEVPHLLPLVEKNAFDTIYLEHVSYFAVKPLVPFLARYGMVISEVSENDYMGGTMRLFIRFGNETGASAQAIIKKEEAAALFDAATYSRMQAKMHQFKIDLLSQLIDAKLKGGKIIGIGAATKGNTLLNFCGIDTTLLDFVTDVSPLKLGKVLPGSHIPIVSDDAITADVTHALILPWNIGTFLKEKLSPKYPKIEFIVPHM